MGNTIIKESKNKKSNDDMSINPQSPKSITLPKRKGSADAKYLSKEVTEQYFNNIAKANTQSLKSSKPLSKLEKTPYKSTGNLQQLNYGNTTKQIAVEQNDIDIDIKNIFSGQKQRMRTYTTRSRKNTDIIDTLEEPSEVRNSSGLSPLNQDDYELDFYRNGEEIRKSYIAKLITTKIWTPSIKEKSHNSLIIFDWDDTLLPTSFLSPKGIYDDTVKLSQRDKDKLSKLETHVLKILQLAIEKGNVYIITNAGPGWVEFSAEKYYPSVVELLKKITIISARGEYESKYPNDSRMWKIQAFLNIQKDFNSDLVTNIICLGDSFIEMEAGHSLAGKFQQDFIKTVKFRESPKPEELNKQLTLICQQFNGIYTAIKEFNNKS